jgi:hypothetical protein
MNTSAQGAARVALERLIDYAGLFPPARLPIDEALAEYDSARTGPQQWMLGRFILPASRLGELRTRAGAAVRDLSVIVDAPPDQHRWFGSAHQSFERIAAERARGMRVASLEIPLAPLATARDTHDAAIGQCAALAAQYNLRDLPIFIEIPRDERFAEVLPGTMDALARYGVGAKLRCGGVDPSAFPSVSEVAAFVAAACGANVPFKATAGLHHPVRHWNAGAGVTMHGFLNLLAAAAFAPVADRTLLEAIVAEEDAHAFGLDRNLRWRDRAASEAEVAATRERRFAGYGSCSFIEPVDDLRALQVLAVR